MKPVVVHAQRREDVIGEIGVELLAARGLDGLAHEVDTDAIPPAIARVARRAVAANDLFSQVMVPLGTPATFMY